MTYLVAGYLLGGGLLAGYSLWLVSALRRARRQLP